MIETSGLTKRYGTKVAVDSVDLRVERGSVYGLVGPNGAGKTTVLGLLAGLRHPTAGSIRISAERQEIAVLADTPRFDPWLTGRETVSLAQHLVTGRDDNVDAVLLDAGLTDAADRSIGGYSRGMLQRLGVACTVVGSPTVVLLDEPASALDPQGRRDVLDLVARMSDTATVVFSSHILSDVQAVCDTVGILDHGRLVFQGALDDLLASSGAPEYRVRIRGPVDPVIRALRSHDWVLDVERTGPEALAIMVSSFAEAESSLAGALAAADTRVVSMWPGDITLERAFLEVTGAAERTTDPTTMTAPPTTRKKS
jgi:ABC-2 type transport system ATP-binding protein